jgi:hypothetical protein
MMRRTMFTAVAAGLTIGGVLGGLFVAGAIGPAGSGVPSDKEIIEAAATARVSGKPPPYKQTVEARYTAERATDEAVQEAPKPTPGTPGPTPARSCPIDESTLKLGVFDGAPYQPPPDPIMRGIRVVGEAYGAGNNGKFYSLFLGAPTTDPSQPNRTFDPQQGIVFAVVSSGDPCADGSNLPGSRPNLQQYPLPFRGEPSKFTQMDRNSVTFETVDGRTGRFNFITRTFSENLP